jgi:hypothetical protein
MVMAAGKWSFPVHLYSQDRTVRVGLTGQDSKYKTVRTGPAGQDRQNDHQERIARKGQQVQDSPD